MADPNAERQSVGVYATFKQVIADLFRDDFAEAGTFSIREYMAMPEGRVLLIDSRFRRVRGCTWRSGCSSFGSVLSGLVQSVIMRAGDIESVKYARSQLGRDQQRQTVPIHGRNGRAIGRQERHDEVYPIAESERERLDNGEVIIVIPDGWIWGKLVLLSTIRPKV